MNYREFCYSHVGKCLYKLARPLYHRPQITMQQLVKVFIRDDLSPWGCRVSSSEAKFSWRLYIRLYMLEQTRRPLKCRSWHLLLSLWGFPNTSGCSQQVVQGCVTLLSISSKLPLPSHPPPSQAWCKYVAYSFWCFIQVILHPSKTFISGLAADFCDPSTEALCVGAEIKNPSKETAGTNLTQEGLGRAFGRAFCF